MNIEVSEKDKTVYYWLSKQERGDLVLRKVIKPEQRERKKKGYQVCVFLSGNESLIANTKELLLHNKEVIAAKSSLPNTVAV